MPTFHLLLASGILATGMETSKVLRLFDCLKIPNVKQRELSNIFKNYVIPGIYSVWRTEQNARMKEIEGEQIVVASDMRVDSPGHSGLFGSGITLDMGRNIILDTQVIKVYAGSVISSCSPGLDIIPTPGVMIDYVQFIEKFFYDRRVIL
jgi:hypothetical protein